MAICIEEIGKNINAPLNASSVCLYSNGEISGLTLTQVVASVCLTAAAAYEHQSVVKMNLMNVGTSTLEDASLWLSKVVNGETALTSELRNFCTDVLGINASQLPSDINTYEKRMQLAKLIKEKIDVLAQSQQEDMIDLQTAINRRDVAYTTSANIIKTLGNSMNSTASNLMR